MSLHCLNDIITDNLAVHIDLTSLKSWDLNTGLSVNSITKWSGAKSDDLNLIDFGLTGFDTGRIDEMWSGITIGTEDNKLNLKPVGFNTVVNPDCYTYSGVTINTEYLPMSGMTTGETGNYFNLTTCIG